MLETNFHLFRLMFSKVTAPLRYFSKTANQSYKQFKVSVSDQVKIVKNGKDFIFNELTMRALNSETGYAESYIGLPFARIFSFAVFTGKEEVNAAVMYGEYNKNDKSKFDPKSRSPFDPLKKYIGQEFIINQNGPGVPSERNKLKQYLIPTNAIEPAKIAFSKVMDKLHLPSITSLNELIRMACIDCIAQGWFGLKDLPAELYSTLKQAEHDFVTKGGVSPAVAKKVKKINDQYFDLQSTVALGERDETYLDYLVGQGKAKDLKQLNALAGLVVEGNIDTCLLYAILQLVSSKPLQVALRAELDAERDNLGSEAGIKTFVSNKQSLIHAIYLEALRLGPAPPLVRYASKSAAIGKAQIRPRTYLFTPLRAILNNPQRWKRPEQFDPYRHLDAPSSYTSEKCKREGSYPLGAYPFIPFSTGRRNCPAMLGFAETIFKLGIATLFMNHELFDLVARDPQGSSALPIKNQIETFQLTDIARFNWEYRCTVKPRDAIYEPEPVTNSFLTYRKRLKDDIKEEREDLVVSRSNCGTTNLRIKKCSSGGTHLKYF